MNDKYEEFTVSMSELEIMIEEAKKRGMTQAQAFLEECFARMQKPRCQHATVFGERQHNFTTVKCTKEAMPNGAYCEAHFRLHYELGPRL